jgi:GNAT superfamily N-acetyltransferase
MTTVREAFEADIPAIQAVGRASWLNTYVCTMSRESIEHALADWCSQEAFGWAIAAEGEFLLVAEGEDGIVGVAQGGMLDPETTILWKLYVLKAVRGRGVGTRLIDGLVARPPEGTRTLFTQYESRNDAAAAFYRARVFVPDRIEGSRQGEDTITCIYVRRPVVLGARGTGEQP